MWTVTQKGMSSVKLLADWTAMLKVMLLDYQMVMSLVCSLADWLVSQRDLMMARLMP